MHTRRRLGIVATFVVAFFVCVPNAFAERIVWLAQDLSLGDTQETQESLVLLSDLLQSDTSAEHIVGESGLARELSEQGFVLPDCVRGTQPCPSPAQSLMSTLRASLLVRILVDGETLFASVVDADLTRSRSLRYDSADARERVFALIGDITNSTGRLRVTTAPAGATVLVDAQAVGQAPHTVTLPVGQYRVGAQLEGYFDVDDDVEVRAGETLEVPLTLTRRFASLLVRSGTPDAVVYLDAEEQAYPVNTVLEVSPGDRTLRLSAPERDPEVRLVTLIAGDDREVRINAELSASARSRREMERLLDRPLMLQGGIGVGQARVSHAGADVSIGGTATSAACLTSTGACSNHVDATSLLVDFDAIYTWRRFEIAPLGLSYERQWTDGAAELVLADGSTADMAGANSVTLRLPMAGARKMFSHVIEVYGRTGFGRTWQRASLERDADGLDGELRTGRWFWDIRGGVRAHLNVLMYGYGDVAFSVPLQATGVRTGAQFHVGVGVNLPDFGLRQALDRRANRARDLPETTAPEDL